MNKIRNNKSFSIIVAVIVLVIFAALGIVGLSLLVIESRIGVDALFCTQAYFVAEGGLQYYFEELQDQSSSWTTPPAKPSGKSLGKGAFSIKTSDEQDDEINVYSKGEVTGADGETVVRVVMAHFTRGGEAYNYAVYVGGTIDTSGSSGFTVTGAGQEDNGIQFPTVDFSYYEGEAPAGQKIYTNHNFNAGTYSGIWYIEGNVTIASNVTVNGSIIATGSITATNKTNISIIASSNYPALVSNNNITLKNNNAVTPIAIDGLIYAGADQSGDVSLRQSDAVNITGTVIAPDDLNVRQSTNVAITYDSSILTDPPPGFSSGGESSWREISKSIYDAI